MRDKPFVYKDGNTWICSRPLFGFRQCGEQNEYLSWYDAIYSTIGSGNHLSASAERAYSNRTVIEVSDHVD